jgi:hypothetical protein
MPLNASDLGSKMIAEASAVAGAGWKDIKQAAMVEFQGLAQRLVTLTRAYIDKEMTQSMVKRHLRTMRYHVVATIAMLTVLLEATIEKMVNKALTVIRDAVNETIGFALIA